jgi:pyridinium-3,5-biscarboxylic acid mononucleotide sulfurtransferase
MDISAKRELVTQNIAGKGSILVAFSGGVDSSLLAVLASDALGAKCRCVLLDSPVVPRAAIADAEEIARRHDLRLEIIPLCVMDDASFRANPADRCYWCRKRSATVLKSRADELGFACVADGMNFSDTKEYRPGLAATMEEGIWHPFIEAGITKEEIRRIAREMDLEFWDKPSAACLSSRIPYGDEITPEKLRMVEEAETFLHGAGFSQVRVRVHGNVARIELPIGEMHRILSIHRDVTTALKSIGFSYVTLDIEGFRSGSMDEVL